MIDLLEQAEQTYPVLTLSDDAGGTQASCQHCEAFRPAPQVSGNLQIDPEIHLPSPGMDVDVAYYYNSATPSSTPYGYGRTLSPYMLAQASGSPLIVTLVRGNGAMVSYQASSALALPPRQFVAQTPGVFNTLVEDMTNNLWKETTPQGKTTAYPRDTVGNITTVSYVQDVIGNTHTYSYSGGLLATIQDAVGRKVSFSYSSGLLQSIQDWAGRVTTFQYDQTSATPRNLLTTVIGPTGCQTAYQYNLVTGTPSSDWLLTGITDPNGTCQ